MSETNFTKGPWTVYISPVELNQGYISVECNSGVIYGEPMYKSSEVEDTANAYLMAAAPEMYEFLESLQLDVSNDYKRDEILAKARGEQDA